MVRFTDRSHPSGEFRERRLRVAIVGTDENALMAAALWMHQGAEFVGLCCLPPENSPDPALLPTLMTPAARMRRPSLAASVLPAWSENPETEERQQQQSIPPRFGGKSERPNASPSSSTSAPSSAAAAAVAQGAAPLDVRHWTGPENLEGTPVSFHTGGAGGGFGGIRVVTPIGSWVERPHMIGLDNEAEIIEQADLVLLMGPPASQQRLLRVVGRHLRPGQALGAIPGGGGFGWKAGRFLQSPVRQGVALFALPVCPWRCRTTAGGEGAEFLATVELLGTSEQEFITFARDVGASDRADILRVFSQLFLTTRFRDGGDMLIASLHPFTTILIPGILYSFYRRSHQDLPNNENDVESEESNGDNFQPFQYFSEIDQYTVDILNQLDQELQQVKKGLDVYFKGQVDFSCFQSLEEYLSQAYHEQIEDHSNLLSIFRTNSAFRNLEIPYLTIRCEEIPKQPTSSSASDNSSLSSRVLRKVVDSPMMKRARPQRRTQTSSSSSSSSSASAVPVSVPPPPATSANNALFALPAQENSSSSSSSGRDGGSGSGADKRERRSSVGGMAASPGGNKEEGEVEEEEEGRRNERLLRQFRNELAHGLLVAKAVADLVGVEVPGMVRILQAAQEDPLRMRILSEDAQLAGPDLGLSGCPQRFGIGSPSELIV